MSKVKIETLTPVHIDSGNLFYKGMDYVIKNDLAYVIDHKKVLDIIGPDKITAWVSSIERGEDITNFISRQGINVSTPADYAKRCIECCSDGTTLKECIHDGRGLAYIPGSSIKGAIRTAVLATELKGIENSMEIGEKKDNACLEVEKRVFSKPLPIERKDLSASNTSFMRFLQVGDAFFDEGCETMLNAINLNIRKSYDSLVDKTKPQAIEAIKYSQSAEFEIRLKKNILKYDREGLIHKLPAYMESLGSLFKTINKHTKKLLEEELHFWEEISKEYSRPDTYIEYIEDLISETDNVVEGKECILRVGYASGWRFMTGAWSENHKDFNKKVVPLSRRGNIHYTDYDFPKSRRVYEIDGGDVDVLGFVKLTLV